MRNDIVLVCKVILSSTVAQCVGLFMYIPIALEPIDVKKPINPNVYFAKKKMLTKIHIVDMFKNCCIVEPIRFVVSTISKLKCFQTKRPNYF